jgi:hypothetical protein
MAVTIVFLCATARSMLRGWSDVGCDIDFDLPFMMLL